MRTPSGQTTTRRTFLGTGVALAATATIGARAEVAAVVRSGRQSGTPVPAASRLLARPAPPGAPIAPGRYRLGGAGERDALLLIPDGYRPDRPAPFALSLHGAGGDADGGLYPLGDLAAAAGLVVLAPASRGPTWDLLRGGFGPDVAFLDAVLAATFGRVAVDPARLAIAGFSDGASYALSLGLGNGDLFGHLLAFSPGFAAPADRIGEPRVFVSHGTEDQILPIDRCSRRLVPPLRREGYDVAYVEFAGGHAVPPAIARRALAWFVGGAAGPAAATPPA